MSDPTCPDLQRLFGDRYVIGHDEAYHADYGSNAWRHDPWLLLIPCKHGHILPWTETELAASVDGHPIIAARVGRLEFTRVVQNGDHGELTACFTLDRFDAIAEIMHPHRRRQWTDEQRQEASERMTQNIASDPNRWAPTAKITAEHAEDAHSPTQTIQSPNLAPEPHRTHVKIRVTNG